MKLPQILKTLTDIGVALSAEKDNTSLLELILTQAKTLTNADAATLYECTEDNYLRFKIVFTDALNIHAGGTSDREIKVPPIPLYKQNGDPNINMVSTWVVHHKKPININDAYHNEEFDFSGTYEWDKKMNYHSQSFLTVPLKNHLEEVIGVLQLINAKERGSDKIIPFSELDEQIAFSLASQAAISITKNELIQAQKKLFDALIELIANAIDEKSPYTANHCRRVPVITKMLAEAVCKTNHGPLKNFSLNEDEIYELDVSAWLHDCGKITIPEYVVDKATKLETIFDRIHLVDTRFEVLKRDAFIEILQKKLKSLDQDKLSLEEEQELESKWSELADDKDFIHVCNIGKETIFDKEILRIKSIAQKKWQGPTSEMEPFLTEEEVQNLLVSRGTLTQREREIINSHASVTHQLLKTLPYPKNLKRVSEFASSHHEKMDGTGYPLGLRGEEIPIQARIIALADVFEALTSSDRPYKRAMPLSQSLKILEEMKINGHIDPDLFDIFMENKIYLAYAEKYLDKKLIDVDLK